jgi:hypothetical protein
MILFFVGFMNSALSQERTTPECLNEQIAMNVARGEIEKYQSELRQEPPGRPIMFGPFGDSRFQDAGWEKWTLNEYYHVSRPSDPDYVQRSSVQIHFMVNMKTHAIAQVKFANTPQQGCVGERVRRSTMDPPKNPRLSNGTVGGGVPEVPPGFFWGPALRHGSFTFIEPKTIENELRWDPNEVDVLNDQGVPIPDGVWYVPPPPQVGGDGCGRDRNAICTAY